MQIGALGDIHGAFDAVQDIMSRHGEVPLWVCVGDVASNEGEYFEPAAPVYWIKGNNEDFDVIAAAIAGKPAAPTLGKSRDDKRRHFVRDEVLICKSLNNIDLFLTHEAPRPFYPAGRRID